ncbi:MAG: hypothetical protein K6E86_08865 [Bacteroidales bacterium]|nr:hypothetical protein [Bacteroidales bacterium]
MCLLVLLCASCHHRDKTRYCTSDQHTLLVYMIADNSLYRYADSNLRQMRNGLLDSETPVNLVIYRDSKTALNTLPQLYQLKRRADSNRTDTVWIKKWSEDVDSTDPEVIAEVMRLTFERFDTPIKGMEIWSHALSWIPSDDFQSSLATRALTSIGEDDGHQSDLWELREGMEQSGVHLDYMMFDACHIASVELAYELRNQTNYLLAPPTETAGAGFPYAAMIKSLSVIQGPDRLVDGLSAALGDYQAQYASCGTMSLICTDLIENLLNACQQLSNQATEVLNYWAQYPAQYQQGMQQYGRYIATGYDYRYLFYDLEEWSEALATQAGLSNDDVVNAIQDCVIDHYYSKECNFGDGGSIIHFNKCCGLTVSIPQFWQLSNIKYLDEAYDRLQWKLSD